MAAKLRNIKLTSVDLVRTGANPEANICLFKSLDFPKPVGSFDTIEEIGETQRYDWIEEINR